MKTAPRERDADRAASANARRTQVEHMKVVARMPTELSVEERNLLSVAYKQGNASTGALQWVHPDDGRNAEITKPSSPPS